MQPRGLDPITTATWQQWPEYTVYHQRERERGQRGSCREMMSWKKKLEKVEKKKKRENVSQSIKTEDRPRDATSSQVSHLKLHSGHHSSCLALHVASAKLPQLNIWAHPVTRELEQLNYKLNIRGEKSRKVSNPQHSCIWKLCLLKRDGNKYREKTRVIVFMIDQSIFWSIKQQTIVSVFPGAQGDVILFCLTNKENHWL